MTLQEIEEVELELKRLQRKIDAVKVRYNKNEDYITGDRIFFGTKETGALKRAALDLKMELTKITK